jgi:hypothetical protein
MFVQSSSRCVYMRTVCLKMLGNLGYFINKDRETLLYMTEMAVVAVRAKLSFWRSEKPVALIGNTIAIFSKILPATQDTGVSSLSGQIYLYVKVYGLSVQSLQGHYASIQIRAPEMTAFSVV